MKDIRETNNGKYEVQVCRHYIGRYETLEEAIKARDKALEDFRGIQDNRRNKMIRGLSDRLEQARQKKDISISELSRRTGIDRNSITNYLYYGVMPCCRSLCDLSVALGVSTDYLLGLKGVAE